jgi:lipoate-protein ligase A
MDIISLYTRDPCFNLAVDEFLLKERKENFLVLSINDPSVIIGKHQVAHRESDTRFITLNNIPLIRRISGGGTVFHDRGNINFSFIMQSEHGKQVDFRKYTLPVINFLSSLGVDADFEGKNDLRVDGLKISGNAEHVYHDRVLHHGTLLFSAGLDLLKKSIRSDYSKYSTRGVGSNPSPVMNLKDKLSSVSGPEELVSGMEEYFLHNLQGAYRYSLSQQEIAAIGTLCDSKYRTWEWNYAYGPEYKFSNYFPVCGKTHHCCLVVKDGIIWNCSVTGSDRMVALAKELIGCRHMVDDIREVFRKENFMPSDLDAFNFF